MEDPRLDVLADLQRAMARLSMEKRAAKKAAPKPTEAPAAAPAEAEPEEPAETEAPEKPEPPDVVRIHLADALDLKPPAPKQEASKKFRPPVVIGKK